MRPTDAPYLRFRASARDFALIAAREEDADTLFFNRRLVVEGDTETALLVKNTLDGIEAPRTRALLRRGLKVAGRLWP
jgi:predicted lipid carrier protein YhbT